MAAPPPEPATDGAGLPLRPDDDALVVRGGVMTLHNLRARLTKAHQEEGRFDISVWTFPGLDATGIANRVRELDPACEHLPHSRMQSARVGDLRALGLDVLLTEPPPYHHAIRFEANPADTDLEALMSVFSEPEDNPVRRSLCTDS